MKALFVIFLLEILFFVGSIVYIFAFRGKKDPLFLFFPLVITSILGGILFSLTLDQRVTEAQRKSLFITGIAPVAMLISIVLHSFISGGITILRGGREFEEPVFFILGIFGCPAAFVAGVIGVIVSFI